MSTEASSLERAVRAELDDGENFAGAPSSSEQLDAFRGDDGKLPNNVFRLIREREGAAGRRQGRPKGARNKRSDDLAKLVAHQHGDPVMAMASMYSMPLDQMIEMVLIADSTAEREERLLGLIDRAETMIETLMKSMGAGVVDDGKIDKLTTMLERVFDAAKALKMKPGDLAIKALNLRLQAAKSVSEYVHSKKPVEANVSVGFDGVMVMPAADPNASFEENDDHVRQAAEGIADMLKNGRIDPARLADFRLVDGQLVEAEFDDVSDDE